MTEIKKTEPDSLRRNLLTDGLIIAGITALTYFLMFKYELGYCRVVGIPRGLIEVNILEFYKVGESFVFLLFILFPWLNMWVLLGGYKLDNVKSLFVTRYFLLFLLVVSNVFLLGISAIESLISLAVLVLILGIDIGVTVLNQKNVKGFWNKYASQEKVEDKVHGIPRFISKRFGNKTLILALLVFFWLPNTFFSLGQSDARKKEQFIVFKRRPALVVIRKYGDRMIMRAMDDGAKKLTGGLIIVDLADMKATEFEYQRLGRLY